MFTAFSWKDFISCIALLFLLYYVVVVFMYYRYELRQLLSGKFKPARSLSSFGAVTTSGKLARVKDETITIRQAGSSDEQRSPAMQADQTPDFNELLQTIQKRVIHAGQEKVVKQELLWMIRSILQQHHPLKNTDNIIAVNDFVIQLVENHCAISLQEEDISPLWD